MGLVPHGAMHAGSCDPGGRDDDRLSVCPVRRGGAGGGTRGIGGRSQRRRAVGPRDRCIGPLAPLTRLRRCGVRDPGPPDVPAGDRPSDRFGCEDLWGRSRGSARIGRLDRGRCGRRWLGRSRDRRATSRSGRADECGPRLPLQGQWLLYRVPDDPLPDRPLHRVGRSGPERNRRRGSIGQGERARHRGRRRR